MTLVIRHIFNIMMTLVIRHIFNIMMTLVICHIFTLVSGTLFNCISSIWPASNLGCSLLITKCNSRIWVISHWPVLLPIIHRLQISCVRSFHSLRRALKLIASLQCRTSWRGRIMEMVSNRCPKGRIILHQLRFFGALRVRNRLNRLR